MFFPRKRPQQNL
uniref:Uncharacterized protein n=1 Tax=Arundo donax TaxID=35708 RepID=A0A0A9HEN6_ARUDO